MKIYKDIFNQITSLENLFLAWDVFKTGKLHKHDVLEFEWNLEENIFALYRELKSGVYKHGPYSNFYVFDPKRRHIHKAAVRDRIVHHAVFAVVNPIFEATFIPTSFSCRVGYGTHKGIEKLEKIARNISRNNTVQTYILKCDIRKFFDTIDHELLIALIKKKIKDKEALRLLAEIIRSFESNRSNLFQKKGLPLGNLTSQLFANIYMNEFDQFMKQKLKVKNYIRYTDDFVIISPDKKYLESLIPLLTNFLDKNLLLELHPEKTSIRKLHQGIDFLGYVSFLNHRLLRAKTKHRISRKLNQKMKEYKLGNISRSRLEQSFQSYLGVLSHANAYKLTTDIKNKFLSALNQENY